MHYTLHLTTACNMACKYCYVEQHPASMPLAIAKKTVDAAERAGGNAGIVFFGGEPLLEKELIYETIAYAKWVQSHGNVRFHFKVTTNGLLIDEEFLRYSKEQNLFIALSHDGVQVAHDKNRVDHVGTGTFARLSPVIDSLLETRPYAPVMMTVDPACVAHYAEGVEYLYQRGFRYLICSMNYAGAWEENSLAELERQYKELARFYEAHTLQEDKFYLSPFEVKLASHIHGKSYCAERCELGKKQLSIAPDGSIYPCVQFVGDREYSIGHILRGVDEKKRLLLYHVNGKEKEGCERCAVKGRCNHHCGCLNRQATGSIKKVCPALCAHERILLPIADQLGERLYKKRDAMFIQKQYNDMYPLLSLIDDTADSINER